MISRVAGNCFWLNRYVERAGSMARLLRVNRAFVPGVDLPHLLRWHPLIVVAGEEESYQQRFGEDEDGETVQEYLTWDRRNASSIVESVRWARENARTARETVSSEMWETINALWHWLQGGPGRRLYRSDRDHFYQHIRQMGELFHGQADETMLNGEPLAFMRLGRYLERAGQTARLMDVHYHTFRDHQGTHDEGPIDDPIRLAQWWALLACCSATEPFQKRYFGTPNAREVVSFLLFEPDLPRSVSHCLRAARHALVHVRGFGSSRIGMVSTALMEALLSHVALREGPSLMGDELHDELTYLVDSVTDLCMSIEQEFFQSTELQTRILAEESGAAQQ
ncbi:MAG: alpha-E domain-containing protein [Myxococcales bacterium]|jgi:uncharacterized alpha-E superfamily protein